MKTISFILALGLAGSAWAKLPPPSEEAKAKAAEVGAGYIPFRHQAFRAESIELSIYLAEGRINRLQIPDPARDVLRLLAIFKLSTLLATPLDLRSHCVLQATEIPSELNQPAETLKQLQAALQSCQQQGLFNDPPITDFSLKLAASKKSKKANDESEPAAADR